MRRLSVIWVCKADLVHQGYQQCSLQPEHMRIRVNYFLFSSCEKQSKDVFLISTPKWCEIYDNKQSYQSLEN